MLDADTRQFLDGKLREHWKNGGSQVAVVTVPSLQGLSVEQAAMKVAESWKLGTKDKDNGLILFIASKEREVRIEVGQGLEGFLTDAHAKRIIDKIIVPAFKEQNYARGVLYAVNAILAYTDPDAAASFGLEEAAPPATVKRTASVGRSTFSTLFENGIFFFIVFAIVLGRVFGGRGSYRRGGYSSWGGSSSWGGGSSSSRSSWSGGGGGFSGGGASGKW